MREPFLEETRVCDDKDAMANSLRAALQRNKTYKDNVPYLVRKNLRESWAKQIKAAAEKYKTDGISDKAHCSTIADIATSLSNEFGPSLIDGRLRYGTSQKAFNLYLKFLWKLKRIPPPPHCLIDAVVLRAAKLVGSWTSSDCQKQYMSWVIALRKEAQKHAKSLGEWEYDLWNRKPAISTNKARVFSCR
jgi:hypothetical protein